MSNSICLGNRYYIGNIILGEGEFGKVIKAIDTSNNTFVACKKVELKRLNESQQLSQLFAHEVMLQSSLNCPNIVKVHNIFRDSDYFYAILDYCENGNLQQYVESKGPLPEKQVVGFVLQILAGLNVLKQKSVLHRDLKPANILMHGNLLKISDFGFSKQISDDNLGKTIIGTPYFLAPEVDDGREYGFEADIYSLGVLIYFMLFNDIPFKGQNKDELKYNKKSEQINFKKNGVCISRQMQHFLQRLLKFDRSERITWEQIYQHPIILNNMNSDNISAEIILAHQQPEMVMNTNPRFLSNQTGRNAYSNAETNVQQVEKIEQEQQSNVMNQGEEQKTILDEQIQLVYENRPINVNQENQQQYIPRFSEQKEQVKIEQPVEVNQYIRRFSELREQVKIEQPVEVNQQELEEKRKLAELKELQEKDIFDGIQKYVHKMNIYGVLITLASTFPNLSNLKINYQISAYLVQKKMKAFNEDLMDKVLKKENIFNMQFFDEFVETEYYKTICQRVLKDNQNIKENMLATKREAEESYKRLNLRRNQLLEELSTTELTRNFQESFLGSLMSYGDGLQQNLRRATVPFEQEILFYHAMLVYTCCNIDKQFNNQLDFDFEKHKNQLLETQPNEYFTMIENQVNRIFTS